MFQVISDKKWEKWCSSKGLVQKQALFSLETCYYGFGFRTRPGTILLDSEKLIHYSYSWRDTLWAIFEPSLMIQVPMSEIKQVSAVELGFWWRQLHGNPDLAVRLESSEGAIHELVLQRNGNKFLTALGNLDIYIQDDQFTA